MDLLTSGQRNNGLYRNDNGQFTKIMNFGASNGDWGDYDLGFNKIFFYSCFLIVLFRWSTRFGNC